MEQFTKKDTNPMTWKEFDELVNNLLVQVRAHFGDRRIDCVTPLHRTGGIVGGMLAIKLGIVPILPVQFKYSYNPTRIDQIAELPKMLIDIPVNPTILFAEGNTSGGSVAKKAAVLIHASYPAATIYLATLTRVYGGFETIDGIERVFHGALTNEKFVASVDEAEKLNLRRGITIFPWENTEHELADINAG